MLDVHHVPARVVWIAFGIIVFFFGVKSRVIGISFFHDFGDADNAGFLAVGMIEKNQITFFHLIPHHVTGLVVSYAVPVFGFVGHGDQVVDAKDIRFGFH